MYQVIGGGNLWKLEDSHVIFTWVAVLSPGFDSELKLAIGRNCNTHLQSLFPDPFWPRVIMPDKAPARTKSIL